MDDLVRWLGEQFDEDELWAIEASRRGDQPSVEGGVHWRWMNTATDEEIVPDPERESYVGEMAEAAADLRSRETWPTASGIGELPQFAIRYSEEVPSAVGSHIVRHDPARVLREINAKRQLVKLHGRATLHAGGGARYFDTSTVCRSCEANYQFPELSWPCPTLRLLALPYADRPGYREEWRP